METTPTPTPTQAQAEALAAYARVLSRPWEERGHNRAPIPPGEIGQDEAKDGLEKSGLILLFDAWMVRKGYHPTLRTSTDGKPLFVDGEGNLIVKIASGERGNAPDVYARVGQMTDPAPILPVEAILGLHPIVVASDDWASAGVWSTWGDRDERLHWRALVVEAINALAS